MVRGTVGPTVETPLTTLLLLHLAGGEGPREAAAIDDGGAVEERLASMLSEGREAWPTCEVSDADFIEHLARLLGDDHEVVVALEVIRAEDVYLACAATLGEREALRVFEAQFIRPTRVVIARERDVIDADEFFQRLRERLLVASPGKRSRLAGFSGKGKLANWVRIAAQRMLIDEYRKRDSTTVTEGADGLIELARAADVDPEIGVLQASFREDFQQAFEGAFSALSGRERTLLRYRYLDGLEVNQIASISGRHRVSVYRAILKARERLLEHLRGDLAQRLHVGSSEAESVMRLMKSQLDVRLSQLFRSRK